MRSVCEPLRGNQYKRFSKREDAPNITDCLTAIEYIFRNVVQMTIPLDYIGNMPRMLVKAGWKVLRVSLTEIQACDLIFLGKKNKSVRHVAMALSDNEAFHSSKKKGGAIEPLATVVSDYTLPEDFDTLLENVDPRSV